MKSIPLAGRKIKVVAHLNFLRWSAGLRLDLLQQFAGRARTINEIADACRELITRPT